MSTVDKGPPSRAADADELMETDADQTTDWLPVASSTAGSNGADVSGKPANLDDTHQDHDSASDPVDQELSTEPAVVEVVALVEVDEIVELENGDTDQDDAHDDDARAEADRDASDNSPERGSNRPSGPVDPGLAMVTRSTKDSSAPQARKNGNQRSKNSSAKKSSANREPAAVPANVPTSESADGSEQLVIVPVSDFVNPPGERPSKRPTDRPTDRTADRPARRPKRPPTPADRAARAPRPAEVEDYRTAPMPRMGAAPTSRGSNRRARVRRVTRVVRHIDPWSTFKAGLLFSLVTYLICLTSGVLLWKVADQTGTIDNMQGWFTQFGWETFELKGDQIFQNAAVLGLFMAVGFTGLIVLGVTIFNLVSDIIGGIRISVLEEEVVERRVTTSRRYAVRRPGVGSNETGGSAGDWAAEGATPKVRRPAPSPLPSTTTNWSVED